ncbi:MAG: ferrochelatase [Patescibacteria group bacterium]|nr:ferrochelatase [Patescibacteria group bacterium]MDE2588864.1 ferrochelatase [Patescibacteria group bacterium]
MKKIHAASKKNRKKITVVLMTYGSPKTLDEVPQYLKNVYGGKDPDPENVKEFQRRYHVIGGSPLIKITQKQAAALQKELNKRKTGPIFRVVAGMRFSHPFIEEVVLDSAKSTDIVVGIIMSPQYSPIIMKGYLKELGEAVEKVQRKDIILKIATDWHLEPHFLKALAKRIKEALKKLPKNARETTPILFSAHSMPKRVIDKEPGYIKDLQETAAKVAKLVGLPKKRWMFCYQSAGHTPEEWLKPDFADIMPILAKNRQTHVIIAPVQFLADHLEILYDVNIGAREQAEEHGIVFSSTKSLNIEPLFIKGLAQVVRTTLKKKK